jgi:hypothetical protein
LQLSDVQICTILGSDVSRDEDEVWKWPAGFEPPVSYLSDPVKLALIRAVQKEVMALLPTFKEDGMVTFWDVNKKTVSRYLEAAQWKTELNGLSVSVSIVETIKWRKIHPMPPNSLSLRESLLKGLRSGE